MVIYYYILLMMIYDKSILEHTLEVIEEYSRYRIQFRISILENHRITWSGND